MACPNCRRSCAYAAPSPIIRSLRPSRTAAVATAPRSAVAAAGTEPAIRRRTASLGLGSNEGTPRRRVGSSEVIGVTDTASASTTWSSSPSAPSAAITKRSAPSAAATGTEESVASPTAAVIDPSPMLRSHDASWASWARSGQEVGEEGYRQRGRLDQWLGEADRARLLEQRHQVDQPEPEAALKIGHGEAGDSDAGECRPAFGLRDRVRVGRRASRRWCTPSRGPGGPCPGTRSGARRRRSARCGPQFRGNPSMRSATTLRWISFVPA